MSENDNKTIPSKDNSEQPKPKKEEVVMPEDYSKEDFDYLGEDLWQCTDPDGC